MLLQPAVVHKIVMPVTSKVVRMFMVYRPVVVLDSSTLDNTNAVILIEFTVVGYQEPKMFRSDDIQAVLS